MPGEDKDQKTEQPTQHKRDEARQEGRFPVSQELSSAVMLCAFFLFFSAYGQTLYGQAAEYVKESIRGMGRLPQSSTQVCAYVESSLWTCLRMLAPFFGVAALTAVGSCVAQTGFVFTPQKLAPRFDRFNPAQGLGKIFGAPNFVQLLFSLLKLAVVGRACYTVIVEATPDIMQMHAMDVQGLGALFFSLFMKLGSKICFVILLIGVIDYVYQRWEYEKSLRMTKEEVKDELKRYEGNSQVKGRIKSIQMSLARQRMMKAVPSADVIITNPTHLAIAVKYDQGKMGAPEVVAKGARLVAERIREIAGEHGIPIVENKPLARALFKAVEVGQQIPQKFYQAVAEILAYVYNLNRKRK